MTGRSLLFESEQAGVTFRANLVDNNQPMVDLILASLPVTTVLGHVVVSGEAIWMPTRILYLGKATMVKRTMGSVYFNSPGQSLAITYGSITESAVVNKIGHVIDEDMDKLLTLGKLVWENTIGAARKEIFKINIRVTE